jgi:ABC-type multidrug transport system ATPase subunit
VGLSDRAGDKVDTFSGGMKRRLNLAAALLHDPQILLLDEPTVGVDPQSRNAIFENLETLRKRSKTLIYTSAGLLGVFRVSSSGVACAVAGPETWRNLMNPCRNQFGA